MTNSKGEIKKPFDYLKYVENFANQQKRQLEITI